MQVIEENNASYCPINRLKKATHPPEKCKPLTKENASHQLKHASYRPKKCESSIRKMRAIAQKSHCKK